MAEVTIDAARVLQLVNDPTLVSLLPPLRTLRDSSRPRARRCRPCGGRKTVSAKPGPGDANQAVRQISSLITKDPEVRRQVKQRLKASVLRFKYPKADGSATIIQRR